MIPPRGSSTAGVTGDVAFAAQSGAWGGDETLKALGWGVWGDPALAAGHSPYSPQGGPLFRRVLRFMVSLL